MKAKTLFDKYSKNFTLVREKYSSNVPLDFPESVACPTCLRIHDSTCLDPKSEYPLSVEHLPSEKLGGKPLILTCKACNNHAGTKLDYPLYHFYKVEPFVKGQENSSVEANIFLGEKFKASATVTTRVIKGRKFLEVDGRINKERIDTYNDLLKNAHGKEFNFAYQRSNPRYVEIAILRIGYLMAFEKLGHSFINEHGHQNIRNQIAMPEKDILPSFGVCYPPLPIDEQGVFVLKFDDDFKCTYVCFEIMHEKTKELIGVMLPPSKVTDLEFYNQLFELQQKGELKNFRSVKLDKKDYLHDPNSIAEIHVIYHAFETGKIK